jgi:hypothetical protein
MTSYNATYVTPYTAVTSVDRGGALLIVNIIGLTVSLLSVGARIYISKRETETGFAVYKDDLMCFAATVC